MRLKMAARKTVGGGSAPPARQRSRAVVLQCSVEAEVDRAVDPKYHTLQRCTLQQACKGVSIIPSSYVELDVDANTRQALASMRCSSDRVQVVKLMDSSTPQQIQMSKEKDRNCFVPTAAQAFRRGQPVGFFSGILQQKDKADREVWQLDDSRHLWFYDIPAESLAEYGYSGPDLVLNMLHRGSELRFAQDAKWHSPDGSNNIAAALWVLPMQLAAGSTLPIPYVFCHAQKQIKKGGELLLDWGDECWAAFHQAQVVKQGGALHRMHLRLKGMRQLAAQHGILAAHPQQQRSRTNFTTTAAGQPPEALPAAPLAAAAAAAGSGAQGGRCIVVFDPDEEEFIMQQQGNTDGSNSSSSSEDAGSMDEDEHNEGRVAERDAGQEGEETGPGGQVAMPAAPLPHDAFVPVEDLQLQQQFVWQLPERLLNTFDAVVIGNGDNGSVVGGPLEGACKLNVVDVVSLHHPARWCTPPNVAARAAVAAKIIKRGEAIIDYVGIVQTEHDYRADNVEDQAYCFAISAQELRKVCPPLSTARGLRDLTIDAREVGGESRFINCTWARETLPDGRPHLNCKARAVWVKSLKRPAVRFFATRRIEAGEEVVADYGSAYWEAMGRSLQVHQMSWASAMLQQQDQLLQLLRAAAAAGRLPATEVEAAASYKPNLYAMVKFEA